ncbi:MAG: hypothetical protein U0359_32875 [Byssovorax sp.]
MEPAVPDRPADQGVAAPMLWSFFAHMLLLATSAVLVPAMRAAGDEAMHDATLTDTFRVPIEAVADPDDDPPRVTTLAPSDPDGREPAESRCGDRGGTMGSPHAAPVGQRYGVQGPADNPDPHIAREDHPPPQSFVSMFLFGPERWLGGDPDAPIAPWGRDDALGNDPESARGHLWGEAIGRAFGSPGAGAGLTILCDTCGAEGRGAGLEGTAPGGATGTERSSSAPPLRAHRAASE